MAVTETRSAEEAIDAYLRVVGRPKRRGRRPSKETLQARLDKLEAAAPTQGAEGAKIAQQKLDLIDEITNYDQPDVREELEKAFIECGAAWAAENNISRQAFASMGVPVGVLRDAGI